jgi:hypothetical protein
MISKRTTFERISCAHRDAILVESFPCLIRFPPILMCSAPLS